MNRPLKPLKILIILTALCTVACSTTTPSTPPQNTAHWATEVGKETNLYRLDDKLFRSEQLTEKDYELLRKNNINTLINLRFFDRNDDRQAFGKTSLTLVNTPLLTWSITPQEVARVLWQIEQHQRNGAVLIHCYHGADRTGLISAMYRVVYQNWELSEAKREMMQGPYGFHSVWKNIEGFFTEKNINEIKQELAKLRQ